MIPDSVYLGISAVVDLFVALCFVFVAEAAVLFAVLFVDVVESQQPVPN